MKKYLFLYEKIKEEINHGLYKKGSKLPSKRIMADNMGTSVITVEHAYELLMEEGYIESREKSGYFVVYESGDLFFGGNSESANIQSERSFASYIKDREEKTKYSGIKEEKMTAADMDYADSNGISDSGNYISYDIYAKTVRRVLSFYPEEVFSKSPSFGTDRLRTAIRDYLYRSRNIIVTKEQIIIGAGAEYLYSVISRTLGKNLIYGIETPGYTRIKEVYENDGVKTETLKLGRDGIRRSELLKSKAHILHITPYRSFPTGVSASAGKKNEYLQWAADRDGIIIEDDFESEFTPSMKAVDTIFSMDQSGRVIYVNTFTQTISPSIRMAYMLLPLRLLERFKDKMSFYSCPVPTLEQLAVSSLIESGEFERHINRVRRKLRR